MPIQWDNSDGTLWLNNEQIGTVGNVDQDGKVSVELKFSYRCGCDDAHLILGALSRALGATAEYRPKPPPPADLTIELDEDCIAETFSVARLLEEKHIKANGYKWVFHKSDADPWPSPLHAHDYDKNVKLDALSGDIFDPATRNKCARLKPKALARVHAELGASTDFAEKLSTLLSKTSAQ